MEMTTSGRRENAKGRNGLLKRRAGHLFSMLERTKRSISAMMGGNERISGRLIIGIHFRA